MWKEQTTFWPTRYLALDVDLAQGALPKTFYVPALILEDFALVPVYELLLVCNTEDSSLLSYSLIVRINT